MSIRTGLNNIESFTKAITYYTMVMLVNNIQHVIKNILNSQLSTSLMIWINVAQGKDSLDIDVDRQHARNYVLLSLILCLDLNVNKPALALSKWALIYNWLVEQLTTFTTKLNQCLVAPLTRDGKFQYVLSIIYNMIHRLVSASNNEIQCWSCHLIQIMKTMRIHLISEHKDTLNAYATDLNIWTSLCQTKGLPTPWSLTLDLCAPWNVPKHLADMKLNRFCLQLLKHSTCILV